MSSSIDEGTPETSVRARPGTCRSTWPRCAAAASGASPVGARISIRGQARGRLRLCHPRARPLAIRPDSTRPQPSARSPTVQPAARSGCSLAFPDRACRGVDGTGRMNVGVLHGRAACNASRGRADRVAEGRGGGASSPAPKPRPLGRPTRSSAFAVGAPRAAGWLSRQPGDTGHGSGARALRGTQGRNRGPGGDRAQSVHQRGWDVRPFGSRWRLRPAGW